MPARFAAPLRLERRFQPARPGSGKRRRRSGVAVTGAIVACAAAAVLPAAAQSGSLESAYIVLGSQGAVARAILSKTTECPAIRLDGGTVQPMSRRAAPDAAFAVLVCETLIPAGTSTATIGGRRLRLPKAPLRTVAAFGDTGCRLKAAEKEESDHSHYEAGRFQDCDPAHWPFARVSRAVAARKPDLVIHVGDYLYRESPCPKGDKGCKGSPYGDNWPAWKADFFRPAAPLLAAAPWIMVRGNHENCGRGGLGYFRFLDPEPAREQAPPACIALVPAYTVAFGGKSFLVMDSSHADDQCDNDACRSAPYAAQFESLTPQPGTWLLSHRPIWGIGHNFTLNQTLQQALAASGGRLPEGFELTLSGHMHIFELLSFADQRPPQIVVGTGGTALDKKIDRRLAGMTVGGATVDHGRTLHKFGFLLIAPRAKGWRATFRDDRGRARFTCALTPKSGRCD